MTLNSYIEDAIHGAIQNGCVCELVAYVIGDEKDEPLVMLVHDDWCPLPRSVDSNRNLLADWPR